MVQIQSNSWMTGNEPANQQVFIVNLEANISKAKKSGADTRMELPVAKAHNSLQHIFIIHVTSWCGAGSTCAQHLNAAVGTSVTAGFRCLHQSGPNSHLLTTSICTLYCMCRQWRRSGRGDWRRQSVCVCVAVTAATYTQKLSNWQVLM